MLLTGALARLLYGVDAIERVLPRQSGLRQWVLTFPFPWRRRLAQDGAVTVVQKTSSDLPLHQQS